MAKVHNSQRGLAIVGLIVNIFIPGVGSLIGGRTKEGVIQLVMSIVAFVLDITIIGLVLGIPLGLAAWIWGIVTGVQMVRESK